jgi:hypothetical protein
MCMMMGHEAYEAINGYPILFTSSDHSSDHLFLCVAD